MDKIVAAVPYRDKVLVFTEQGKVLVAQQDRLTEQFLTYELSADLSNFLHR